MKIEARVFDFLTVFFLVSAVVYGFLSKEPVGLTALTLVGGMALIIGTYFRFVSRRLEPRPEDNPHAEVSDGAGDVGFFSPGSYWPIAVAAGASITAIGLAFFYLWLMITGLVILLLMVGGLVFEYHLGPGHE